MVFRKRPVYLYCCLLVITVCALVGLPFRYHSQPARTRHVHRLVHREQIEREGDWLFLVHTHKTDPRYMYSLQHTWFQRTADFIHLSMIEGASDAYNDWLIVRDSLKNAWKNNPNLKYFAIFRPSTYVYTKNLISSVIEHNTTKAAYWGYPRRDGAVVYPAKEAGIVLNLAALKAILFSSECGTIHTTPYDVHLGRCMRASNITFHPLMGLHPSSPWQMLRDDLYGRDATHVNPVTPEDSYAHPLSYADMEPLAMLRMHDNIHLYNRYVRSPMPRIMHQYWEGSSRSPPRFSVESCREMHQDRDGWEYKLWNNHRISTDLPNGQLVNQEWYDKPRNPLNLLSDIARYEFLLFYGGVWVDADTMCIQPFDSVIDEVGAREGFVAFENEYRQPGLFGSSVIGMRPFSPIMMLMVLHLSKTNWNLPPWQSAGPLYLTQQLDLFTQHHAETDVLRLPSHFFYPFHHSDRRPTDRQAYLDLLYQKAAISDQMWGTTFDSYPDSKDLGIVSTYKVDPTYDPTWEPHALDRLLREYIPFHRQGLTAVSRMKPRWLVAIVGDAAGMCNRMMHYASALLFAILTGRTLLFDWDYFEPKKHGGEKVEVIGMAPYHEIFADPPIDFSFRHAKKRLDLELEPTTIWFKQPEFLEMIATQQLDAVFYEDVVYIERFDWWGAALFRNKHYTNILQGVKSEVGFRSLVQFLFRLKGEMPPATECDWLVQIRRHWDRKTAPASDFYKCAKDHGYTGTKDRMLLLADEEEDVQTLQDAHPDDIVVHSGKACRGGEGKCYHEALYSLYRASTCKHAVITYTSTFAACAVGMGVIRDSYVTMPTGECVKRPSVDPVGSGVLAHETNDIQLAVDLAERTRVHASCYLYDMKPATLQKEKELHYLLHAHANLKDKHKRWPVVVVVESIPRWQYLHYRTNARLYFLQGDDLPTACHSLHALYHVKG